MNVTTSTAAATAAVTPTTAVVTAAAATATAAAVTAGADTGAGPVAMALAGVAEAVVATRMDGRDGDYRPSLVAGILHSLPHLNIRLHLINSTFAPENKLYLESLGILAFIPAACLIFTLLVLLLYFLTRCCDRKPKPKRSITPCKWFCIVVFVLLIWGAVALSLYGNHEMHDKITDVLKGMKGMDDSVTELEVKMERFEESRRSAAMRLDQLKFHNEPPPSQQSRNEELAQEIQQLSKYVHGDNPKSRFAQIRSSLRIFKKAWLYKTAGQFELYRWIGTMVLWGLMVLLCLMLLIGLCSHSRCTLITFSVCGLLMVIASWLQASLYLFASVAIGDYCMQPDMYLRTLVRPEDQRILDYYMHCGVSPNPWTAEMNATSAEVATAVASFQRASQMVSTMYRDKGILMDALGKYMLELNQTLPELHSHLDCRNMHRNYLASTRICDKGLCGLCFMLVASVLSGLFFTILFWVDSHIWIYLDNRRDYTQVDGQDRYLPPSAASQAIAARTLRGQGSYSTSGLFRQKNLHDGNLHAVTQHLLDGKGVREEKSQHGGVHPGGSDTLPGPNHGQYATLSKQCKTLESNDFYN